MNDTLPSLNEQLWGRVDRSSANGCWLWTGSRNGGYGTISVGGKALRAHRLAYELTHGPIPQGAVVMHTCDNPPCVNPGHLKAGSQLDNIQDMLNKGRHRALRGEESPSAKLTDDAVEQIRISDEPGTVLADRFGVSTAAIGCVRRGQSWGHDRPSEFAIARQRRNEMEIVACEGCGGEFERPRFKRARFCSRACCNSSRERRTYSDAELLDHLRTLARTLGRTPGYNDLTLNDGPSTEPYRDRFGSLSAAQAKAGLEPNRRGGRRVGR